MIIFKTKFSYKNCFLGNYYTITRSGLGVVLFFLIIWPLILYFVIGSFNFVLYAAFLIIFLIVVVPSIRYLFVKFYYKMNGIEYFFDEEEFGYANVVCRTVLKINTIKAMKFNKRCIFINFFKGKLIFLGDPKDIEETRKKLEMSDYKQFIKS